MLLKEVAVELQAAAIAAATTIIIQPPPGTAMGAPRGNPVVPHAKRIPALAVEILSEYVKFLDQPLKT